MTEILQALEKVLLDLLESKISEALLLVPENYGMARIAVIEVTASNPTSFRCAGKFVISVDDMMPQVSMWRSLPYFCFEVCRDERAVLCVSVLNRA